MKRIITTIICLLFNQTELLLRPMAQILLRDPGVVAMMIVKPNWTFH